MLVPFGVIGLSLLSRLACRYTGLSGISPSRLGVTVNLYLVASVIVGKPKENCKFPFESIDCVTVGSLVKVIEVGTVLYIVPGEKEPLSASYSG